MQEAQALSLSRCVVTTRACGGMAGCCGLAGRYGAVEALQAMKRVGKGGQRR